MYGSQDCLSKYGENLMILRESYVDENEKLKGMMNYTISKFNEFCEKEIIDLNIDLL